MKFFAFLFAALVLFVAIVYAEKEAFGDVETSSIEFANFPCNMTGTAKPSRLENKIYQCIGVTGKVLIKWLTSPEPRSNDKYSLLVLNSTEYTNWSRKQSYTCINHNQCSLKDASLKRGEHITMMNGEDIFFVFVDRNMIQRAHVNYLVSVSKATFRNW